MRVLVGTSEGLHEPGRGVVAFDGRKVTALAPGSEGLWAIVDSESVWRGDGPLWERAAETPGRRLNCVVEASGDVWAGAAEAHLLKLANGQLEDVASFDKVEGREGWYTPWGGPPDVRSLSAGPDGVLYANVHVGGIVRSTDGGATWEPTIDVDTDVHRVVAHPETPALVLAALGAGGLAMSADGGGTWAFGTGGLHATYCRAVTIAGDAVLLSASTGPFGGRGAVYRRPLSGGAFERCTSGLPDSFGSNIDSHWLDARGTDAAFGTPDGEVYASTDAGQTWTLAGRGLPAMHCVVLAPDG